MPPSPSKRPATCNMMMLDNIPASPAHLLLWGLIATVAMTTVFVGNRKWALILGFVLYTIGGWLFAFLYYLLFASVSIYTWWFGGLVGSLHGVFLLVTVLPLLPFLHPRMASEYHGLTSMRQLEPPGFLALNYGYGTPAATMLGQILYGMTLGGFLQLQSRV
jgi:uncharacterized membrane protein YagU involved in acid resistance